MGLDRATSAIRAGRFREARNLRRARRQDHRQRAVLPGGSRPVFRQRCRGAGPCRDAGPERWFPPRHHRKAIRVRPRLGPRLERKTVGVGRREPVFPYRPFPRQGDGARHHGHPFRERDVRADVAPRICRFCGDHSSRNSGRGAARQFLRADRRVARHGAEPHVSVIERGRDGAAEQFRRRSRAR